MGMPGHVCWHIRYRNEITQSLKLEAMKNKSNKNEKKTNSSARERAMASRLYRNRNKKETKLTKEDYLYSFPTCGLGSQDAVYMDEIVVYYSFS